MPTATAPGFVRVAGHGGIGRSHGEPLEGRLVQIAARSASVGSAARPGAWRSPGPGNRPPGRHRPPAPLRARPGRPRRFRSAGPLWRSAWPPRPWPGPQSRPAAGRSSRRARRSAGRPLRPAGVSARCQAGIFRTGHECRMPQGRPGGQQPLGFVPFVVERKSSRLWQGSRTIRSEKFILLLAGGGRRPGRYRRTFHDNCPRRAARRSPAAIRLSGWREPSPSRRSYLPGGSFPTMPRVGRATPLPGNTMQPDKTATDPTAISLPPSRSAARS